MNDKYVHQWLVTILTNELVHYFENYFLTSILLLCFLCQSLFVKSQTFIAEENDTTVNEEYFNGQLWAYRQIGDFVVGVTNNVEKDNYGKYYRIEIFIKSFSENPYTVDPSLISAVLTNKRNKQKKMEVFTYEEFMRKVQNAQLLSMALTSFSMGVNAGLAGTQTTYTTTYQPGRIPSTSVSTTYNYGIAAAANLAASNRIMSLDKMMSDEKKIISQGYLRKHTLHYDEGIVGYFNIKYKRGKKMTVTIPIGDNMYSFTWNISSKQSKDIMSDWY